MNHHKIITKTVQTVCISILLMISTGCSLSSAINVSNPKFIKSAAAPHATVYFVRPPLVRTRGVADSNIKIELDEIPLIELGTAEYTVAYLQPGATDIIIRSLSFLTTKPMPVEVWRARRFELEAGETYYIEAQYTEEEFRGTYYVPVLRQRADFQSAAEHIKPIGDLAKKSALYDPPPVLHHELVVMDDL